MLQHILQAGDGTFIHSYPLNSPAIFAILIGCMRKNRYGITLGIQDRCANNFRTSVLISCTHGDSRRKCEDDLDHPGISWIPTCDEPQLAVHGTSLENWGLIVEDGFMKSMGRTDIHFTVFRKGMMVKEMPQLLKKGIFLLIDPGALSHTHGFTVVQNINDVIKIEGGEKGMSIEYLISAIDGKGNYADLDRPYFRVPHISNAHEPLLQEFVQQLQNPATALFNDSYGTRGTKARQMRQQAEALADGYRQVAQSLNLAKAAEPPLPQIMDEQASGSNSDFKDYNTNPRIVALADRQKDAEPLVENLLLLLKTVEDMPQARPQLTSVSTQIALQNASSEQIKPFDEVNYGSDSDGAESYESDTMFIWSTDRLRQFDACYEQIAIELSRVYTGLSLAECKVVVQAFTFLKKVPVLVKPCRAAIALAMNAIAARQVCGDYVPPNPVDMIRNSNNEIPLKDLQSDDFDQSEAFDSLRDKKPFFDRFQWLYDPIFDRLKLRVKELAASAGVPDRWFQYDNIPDEPQFGFHDPAEHHHFMKNSHVLCQDVWVPKELVPTPEEIQAARLELDKITATSEEGYLQAVTSLSGDYIPHDQHEYTLRIQCSSCKVAVAPQCLVCGCAVCIKCRNILFPYKDGDGEQIENDAHPVQCECTKHAFLLALMKARKALRPYCNREWHYSGEHAIAPLSAVAFTRALFLSLIHI